MHDEVDMGNIFTTGHYCVIVPRLCLPVYDYATFTAVAYFISYNVSEYIC